MQGTVKIKKQQNQWFHGFPDSVFSAKRPLSRVLSFLLHHQKFYGFFFRTGVVNFGMEMVPNYFKLWI
jgi:hypothetical protein